MSNTVVVLSHDGFGRFSILRRLVPKSEREPCAFCGQMGKYQYGYEPEDSCREYFSPEIFCSKSCYDAYHH